jgi:hypothetical protein
MLSFLEHGGNVLVVHYENYTRWLVVKCLFCGQILALLGQSRTMVVVLAPGMVGGFKVLY